MSSQEFFKTRAALVTTIAACLVVIVSLGIRQTFGLFFFDFEVDLGCTQTEFGFAMGVQLFMWGLFGPLFGMITDKFSGRTAVFIGHSESINIEFDSPLDEKEAHEILSNSQGISVIDHRKINSKIITQRIG